MTSVKIKNYQRNWQDCRIFKFRKFPMCRNIGVSTVNLMIIVIFQANIFHEKSEFRSNIQNICHSVILIMCDFIADLAIIFSKDTDNSVSSVSHINMCKFCLFTWSNPIRNWPHVGLIVNILVSRFFKESSYVTRQRS